ncbi:uncharacterized protein LOC105636246 isoform X2 [Jatropha curcas]|uniref:uncharacterized protein LOC105636246 isoform X2 n=1 Tax=Jatropha curcas TaxID=180498 RepID=UPI0005FB5556|nr:uncharacterized protein LOC105636246 isoform X2 [Jatropha curcas]
MIAAPVVDPEKFTSELGWRSSNQAAGTPIKKLLAEEMSREIEPKKRSLSVIARLMGLDGLPTQQLSQKQQKRSSENVQRIALTEKGQRSSTSCSRRSSRKSSKEEQEFKDVFEVSDTSKMENSSHSLQGSANSKLTDAEMAFIQQKFMDARRLSADEKFHDLKEFHDVIDDLESNKDLLLKFLEQPDSLFTKHLHDLQTTTSQSHCRHISDMKPSRALECGGSGLGCKIERETPLKNRRKYNNDPLSHSYSKHAADDPVKSSKIQSEEKVGSSDLPTRIVVLKPNFGKVQNASRAISSPRSSHDFLSDSKKHTEFPGIKNREVELCGKKRFSDDAGLPRHKSRESREIAKEITRQMRNSLASGSIKFPNSGVRGYAGDESSSNRSDNESANESDAPTVFSRNSSGWSNRYRPSSSHFAESSVSTEARKRLSERWKMTHRSADMGVVNRSSTLGEMLALPDREPRLANADAMVREKGFSGKFDGHAGKIDCTGPLGISSRDGWKEGYVRNLSRSRSVPASFTTVGSPRTGMRHETLCNDRFLLPKEVMQQERTKTMKGNFNWREGSSRSSRSRIKRSHFSECNYSDPSDTSPEISYSHNQVQSNITNDDLFKQCYMASETSAAFVTDTSLVPESAVDLEIDNVATPSKPTVPELPAYTTVKGNSPSSDQEALISQESSNVPPDKESVPMQHSVTELESPASSKETEQPSPVSVLETPFPDDLSSSSECFESLSADLHGLRMQLQLLKLESAYAEGPMLISSDEDVDEDSLTFSEAKIEESREFSYVVDVLQESGINDADPDAFMASWHSSECPMNPLVFEEVEKKNCNLSSWPRSERKLLFDRINSALLVINQQFADPHPWVRLSTAIIPKWSKNGLRDSIHKLLASQETQANNNAAEMALVMDSEWLDLRDGIDVVGRDIEKLLIEELVKEI